MAKTEQTEAQAQPVALALPAPQARPDHKENLAFRERKANPEPRELQDPRARRVQRERKANLAKTEWTDLLDQAVRKGLPVQPDQ
jgi:hypothetical protein